MNISDSSNNNFIQKIIEEDKDGDDFTSQYNFFKTTIYKKN